MNVRSEQLDTHVLTLVATIAPEDYREEYASQLKKSRKSLTLKGFRPGQVPLGLAEKMLGPRIRLDVVQRKLEEGIGAYMQEQGLHTYSRLLPNADQPEQDIEAGDATFTFRMDVGVLPELPEGILPKITLLEPEVDDAYAQARLEEKRREHAKDVPCEQVKAGCSLRMTLAPLGMEIEGGELVERRMRYGDLTDELQAALLDKRVGDTCELDTPEGLASDPDLRAHLLRKLPQDAYALEGSLRLRVLGITESEPAPVDETLYMALAPLREGEERPVDLDAWHARYVAHLQQWCTYEARAEASDAFLRRIEAAWDFEAPIAFALRMIESYQEANAAEAAPEDLQRFQQQIKAEAVRSLLASPLDWEAIGQASPNDDYMRYLAAKAIGARAQMMGFPPYFFDSIDRSISFGVSIYQDKLQEIVEPVQLRYTVAWESMRRVGYETRRVTASEYTQAAKAEYGEVGA